MLPKLLRHAPKCDARRLAKLKTANYKPLIRGNAVPVRTRESAVDTYSNVQKLLLNDFLFCFCDYETVAFPRTSQAGTREPASLLWFRETDVFEAWVSPPSKVTMNTGVLTAASAAPMVSLQVGHCRGSRSVARVCGKRVVSCE